MNEELSKIEGFISSHKVWIFGILGVLFIWYLYKQFSANASAANPAGVSSGGGTTGVPAGTGTSGTVTNGTDYGSQITALQNAINGITTQIGTITAPIASSLGLTFSVGGQYDNSNGYTTSYGTSGGSNIGISGGGGGLAGFFASLGGGSSKTTANGFTAQSNNTKNYVSNIGLTETGLSGTALSSIIAQFVGVVSNAQTAANSSGATTPWFVPAGGNTPGAMLATDNGHIVFTQPGGAGNPNSLQTVQNLGLVGNNDTNTTRQTLTTPGNVRQPWVFSR